MTNKNLVLGLATTIVFAFCVGVLSGYGAMSDSTFEALMLLDGIAFWVFLIWVAVRLFRTNKVK